MVRRNDSIVWMYWCWFYLVLILVGTFELAFHRQDKISQERLFENLAKLLLLFTGLLVYYLILIFAGLVEYFLNH